MRAKMEAHVFTNHGENKLVGKLTFSGNHSDVLKMAKSLDIGPDFTANLDVFVGVPIGLKLVWVVASPNNLDNTAEELAQLASDMRHDMRHDVAAE